MKKYFIALFTFLSTTGLAQLPITEEDFFSRISKGTVLPEKLLSARTAVFFDFEIEQKQLEVAQSYFQRAGVDAVVYIEDDNLTAGRDLCVATAQYLNTREISYLIFLRKLNGSYHLVLTEYNHKANFVEERQVSWWAEETSMEAVAKQLYLATASAGLKRGNFLINDVPEMATNINPIDGRRNEFFAVDLKVDMLAVPRFNDPEKDRELEEIMKNYPYKFSFTDPNLSEADLRKQGFLYVLRFINARAKVAKRLMGYDMSRSESAIVSITYPASEPHLKNIGANEEVFKFYFKHIESQNVFLGSKWDAETTWQQALINQLKAYRIEFKLN